MQGSRGDPSCSEYPGRGCGGGYRSDESSQPQDCGNGACGPPRFASSRLGAEQSANRRPSVEVWVLQRALWRRENIPRSLCGAWRGRRNPSPRGMYGDRTLVPGGLKGQLGGTVVCGGGRVSRIALDISRAGRVGMGRRELRIPASICQARKGGWVLACSSVAAALGGMIAPAPPSATTVRCSGGPDGCGGRGWGGVDCRALHRFGRPFRP